jgi:hypothetical protein
MIKKFRYVDPNQFRSLVKEMKDYARNNPVNLEELKNNIEGSKERVGDMTRVSHKEIPVIIKDYVRCITFDGVTPIYITYWESKVNSGQINKDFIRGEFLAKQLTVSNPTLSKLGVEAIDRIVGQFFEWDEEVTVKDTPEHVYVGVSLEKCEKDKPSWRVIV